MNFKQHFLAQIPNFSFMLLTGQNSVHCILSGFGVDSGEKKSCLPYFFIIHIERQEMYGVVTHTVMCIVNFTGSSRSLKTPDVIAESEA